MKTKFINNSLSPTWDEKFNVYICHYTSVFTFKVKDKDHVGAAIVGLVSISAEDLASGEVIEDWFDLLTADGETAQGQINISIQYISKEDLDEEAHELEDTYFPVRESCRMIMYQDADTPQMPQFEGISNPDGSQYQATRAWRDLFECIKNAQKFIYITGWSVFTAIQLLRGN